MTEQETPAVELAFTELAAVIREKDKLGLTFDEYLKELEKNASAAARKLDVAQAVANMCEATKTRKPRKDRGVPRKKNGTGKNDAPTGDKSQINEGDGAP